MSSSRRGQTALEMMFIVAIIMAGLVVIVNAYVPSESSVSLTYYLRSSLSDACSFLNTGVAVNGTGYKSLSSLVELSNYSSIGCNPVGLNVTRDSLGWNVTVKLQVAVAVPSSSLESAVKDYLTYRLTKVGSFSVQNGELYYRGLPVRIRVECVGCG